MMPGFGTFHHMKEQQLTLQLPTTRCAWPHLPCLPSLIAMGNPPDTNHHHDPCPAKPAESVSIGFSGSRWKFCAPTFPLLVQYLEPQSCRFCLTLLIAAPVLGSQLSSLHPILLQDSTVMGWTKSFLPLALLLNLGSWENLVMLAVALCLSELAVWRRYRLRKPLPLSLSSAFLLCYTKDDNYPLWFGKEAR